MILNSTKFGGNRTKDLEVGPDRQTDKQIDRPIPIYPPSKLRIIKNNMKNKKYHTVGPIPKSIIKIIEIGKIDTPDTQIHDHSLS